jgi:simple sugar transport system permease protein
MSIAAVEPGERSPNGYRAGVAGIILGVAAMLVVVPPLTLENPVLPTVLVLGSVLLGAVALRLGNRLGATALFVGVMGEIVALVTQHAAASTVNAVVTASLFAGTLVFATPLILAGVGGLYSERSGVVNIGLEGMILTGAFFGIWACDKAGSWEVGILGAAFFGGLLAALHAFFSIQLRSDQIVSGTAVNILALGGTGYAFRSIYGDNGVPPVPRIPSISLHFLSSVPLIGKWLDEIFSGQNLLTWFALLVVVITWAFLGKTPWGLRMRAVGEHPRAADTVGIPVFPVRYAAVILSGVLAGIAGAYLSFGFGATFNEGMSGGNGFIALAALIFGKWKPFGVLGAALLFGFAIALGNQLQTSAGISTDLTQILPYAFTLIALVGLVGRSIPPAAVGKPYQKQ